jgi:hypothetical protein
MNRRNWLIALAMLVPLAAIVAWWFNTFERVQREFDAAPRGEARYNPMYALKKALQARGIAVDSRANLNLPAMHLQSGDTLVLGANVRTLTDAQAHDLIDWIEDGGHLIFAMPDSKGRGGMLLDTLGLKPADSARCHNWAGPSDDSKDSHWHCFFAAFKLEADEAKDFDVLWGKADTGYVLGQRTRGDGTFTAVGDLSFLQNAELKSAPNSELAWQVLAPAIADEGKVHIVYAADVPPLHVLLVQYGWPALLPAALALLAWLWGRAQRFGPSLPLGAPHRRALLEHVQAAGDFIFRRGAPSALYAPVQRRFFEKLRRDDPVIAALDGDALVDALANKAGRSAAEVRLALQPLQLTRPEHFLASIKILHEMENQT